MAEHVTDRERDTAREASAVGPQPLEAAQKAKEQGIPVYTVALGTPEGVVEEFGGGSKQAPPDKETLRRIAEITGGEFFSSSSATDLARIYDHLDSSLGFVEEKRDAVGRASPGPFARQPEGRRTIRRGRS